MLDYFIRSFEEPASKDVIKFWGKMVHHEEMGSGSSFLSGWLTAFCFWKSEGRRIVEIDEGSLGGGEQVCRIDGTTFSCIGKGNIPNGHVSVPVKVIEHGKKVDTKMVAGSVGIAAISSGEPQAGSKAGLDTLQPVSGWWMYEGYESE